MDNPVVEHNAAAIVDAIRGLNETVGGWATFTPTARRRARAVYNFSYEVATGRIVAFRNGHAEDVASAGPEIADDGRVSVAFDFAKLPDLRAGQRLGNLVEVVDLECLGKQACTQATWAAFQLTRIRANELLGETHLE